MANKSVIVTCAAAAGLELMEVALNSLHTSSSDDEADRTVEEANVVGAWMRVGNRDSYEVRK